MKNITEWRSKIIKIFLNNYFGKSIKIYNNINSFKLFVVFRFCYFETY